jgi:proline iminopeptidase
MLTAAFINQNPDQITGAIFAEPGGFTWEQTEAYIKRSRALHLFSEATNDLVYQDQLITGNDHNTLDYKMILSTAGDIATGDTSPPPYWRYGAVCNSASIRLATNNPEQMDFTANLGSYNSKVLFAYSELNTSYGLEHAQLVSAALPNVELVEILGSGHEMPHFGWNKLYPVIQNYLIEIL